MAYNNNPLYNKWSFGGNRKDGSKQTHIIDASTSKIKTTVNLPLEDLADYWVCAHAQNMFGYLQRQLA